MSISLAFLSLVFEALFGYPKSLLERIGHPVMWIGSLIDRLDERFNRPTDPPARRRRNGTAVLLVTIATVLAAAVTLQKVFGNLPFGWIVLAPVAGSLIAQRSLAAHVGAVAKALDTGGIEAGRAAVAEIVGRDTEAMEEADVCRAAIESLAENFSDGVVAPAFWLALAGLPGIAVYKAINTADSMIGHRSDRHLAFGWAAARTDDWINLPASRLSALLVAGAASITGGCNGGRAWRTVRRDARRHRSPNAGWPEAAFAGALGLALAGPRRYGGRMTEDPYIGDDNRRALTRNDIRRALRLYWAADGMLIVVVGILAALFEL